jgi:hypothetical protein
MDLIYFIYCKSFIFLLFKKNLSLIIYNLKIKKFIREGQIIYL